MRRSARIWRRDRIRNTVKSVIEREKERKKKERKKERNTVFDKLPLVLVKDTWIVFFEHKCLYWTIFWTKESHRFLDTVHLLQQQTVSAFICGNPTPSATVSHREGKLCLSILLCHYFSVTWPYSILKDYFLVDIFWDFYQL